MARAGANVVLGKAARDPLDFYPTEQAFAKAALFDLHRRLDRGPVEQGRRVLDVGCGDGVWGFAYREIYETWTRRGHVVGIEPDLGRALTSACMGCATGLAYDEVVLGDYLATDLGDFDLIIGNPPYGKILEPIIHKSIRTGKVAAFLVKASFYCGGQERHKTLFEPHPPSIVFKTPKRPFPGHAEEYLFLVWVKGWEGPTQIEVIEWV